MPVELRGCCVESTFIFKHLYSGVKSRMWCRLLNRINVCDKGRNICYAHFPFISQRFACTLFPAWLPTHRYVTPARWCWPPFPPLTLPENRTSWCSEVTKATCLVLSGNARTSKMFAILWKKNKTRPTCLALTAAILPAFQKAQYGKPEQLLLRHLFSFDCCLISNRVPSFQRKAFGNTRAGGTKGVRPF